MQKKKSMFKSWVIRNPGRLGALLVDGTEVELNPLAPTCGFDSDDSFLAGNGELVHVDVVVGLYHIEGGF